MVIALFACLLSACNGEADTCIMSCQYDCQYSHKVDETINQCVNNCSVNECSYRSHYSNDHDAGSNDV